MTRAGVAAAVAYVAALTLFVAAWWWYATGYDGPPVPTTPDYVIDL